MPVFAWFCHLSGRALAELDTHALHRIWHGQLGLDTVGRHDEMLEGRVEMHHAFHLNRR